MALTPDQIRAWTVASCADQQVPVAVTDAGTLRDVAVLLSAGRPRPVPQGAARPAPDYSRQTGRTRSGSNGTEGVPGPTTA